jgi:TonB family protein
MRQLTATIVLLAAGRLAGAAILPAEVLGTWQLSEAAADLVAPNCRTMTFRFDATTVTQTSGEMVLRASYVIEGEGAPLSLRQVITEYNARPNCIGRLLPVAVGQQLANMRIEVQGNRLRLQLLERRGSMLHVDLVRSQTASGTVASPSGPAVPTIDVVQVLDPTVARPKCSDITYPEPAVRDGAQGTTRIRFVIDAAGRATQPLITHSAGPTRAHRVLDRTAVEALVKCEFTVDAPAQERVSVIDYIWRLPATGRPSGQ